MGVWVWWGVGGEWVVRVLGVFVGVSVCFTVVLTGGCGVTGGWCYVPGKVTLGFRVIGKRKEREGKGKKGKKGRRKGQVGMQCMGETCKTGRNGVKRGGFCVSWGYRDSITVCGRQLSPDQVFYRTGR